MANSGKIAQKIPIRPSKAQAAAFERCFGERRLAYNSQVAAFDSYDAESNPDPSYPGVSELKAANPWMAGSPMPSNALSNAIMDFRKARSAYFRAGSPSENRPRFKSKRDAVQSFRNSMPIRRMEGRRYPLSRKLGSVKIPKRDPLRFPISALSSWTVKREGAKYYLVLLFDAEPAPLPPASGEVGIDLGVKDLMVLSTGERVDLPGRMRELEESVRREQRRLSRKKRGCVLQL